jgi:hypothetical protein
MWRIGGFLCVSVVAVALIGCDPVLVREFRVTPAQVGDSTFEAKASSTLASFDMLPFNAGGTSAFGFRRQWPNLATDRPGEISVTFAPESSGDAWLVRLRQWPVAHQTHFGANVEAALVDELTRSGYKVLKSQ